jgi:hypothetical protein
MNTETHLPLTDIIPSTRHDLLKNLAQAGIYTLQDCGNYGEKLKEIPGVCNETLAALKEHCWQNGVVWSKSHEEIQRMAKHFMVRYNCSLQIAQTIAHAFFWDSCHPSSMTKHVF